MLYTSNRVIVENAFGIVKRKWKIVRIAPIKYILHVQTDLIYVVCGLWNFLVYEGTEPSDRFELEGLTGREKRCIERARQRVDQEIGTKSSTEVRQQITDDLWSRWNR